VTTISVIVPTLGRPSLLETLASIETWPGDEVIVVGAVPTYTEGCRRFFTCASGGDWGCTERTIGLQHARGDYLAFLDDDDVYLPGARVAMARAIIAAPHRPTLCRMVYPNGFVLWHEPTLRVGNVSTQMMLIPNDPSRLGTWTTRREGDYDFLASMDWAPDVIHWSPEIIARLGHNDDGTR